MAGLVEAISESRFVERPGDDEYAPYYGRYISSVPDRADLMALLAQQRDDTAAKLRAIPLDAGDFRYAPDKWSVKEVIGHLSDTERIMAYRALCIGRGEVTPLPGFDQNAYTPEARSGELSLSALIEEWVAVRQASLALFRNLPTNAWARRGTASDNPVSVRALAYIIAGHLIHHRNTLHTLYGV